MGAAISAFILSVSSYCRRRRPNGGISALDRAGGEGRAMHIAPYEWFVLTIKELYATSETNLSQLRTVSTCGAGDCGRVGAAARVLLQSIAEREPGDAGLNGSDRLGRSAHQRVLFQRVMPSSGTASSSLPARWRGSCCRWIPWSPSAASLSGSAPP